MTNESNGSVNDDEAEETVVEWAVVSADDEMGPGEFGMYEADNEKDARDTLARWRALGETAWLERRTVRYGVWESVQ